MPSQAATAAPLQAVATPAAAAAAPAAAAAAAPAAAAAAAAGVLLVRVLVGARARRQSIGRLLSAAYPPRLLSAAAVAEVAVELVVLVDPT